MADSTAEGAAEDAADSTEDAEDAEAASADAAAGSVEDAARREVRVCVRTMGGKHARSGREWTGNGPGMDRE